MDPEHDEGPSPGEIDCENAEIAYGDELTARQQIADSLNML